METNELLLEIQQDLSTLKKVMLLYSSRPAVSDKWLSRSQVIDFLDYGDTQMGAREKSGEIVVSKIGRRKFIHRDSLEALLNKNKAYTK